MPKLKTRKSAFKRYKKTSLGKFLRHHAFKSNLLRKKSKSQKRKLSQTIIISKNDSGSVELMIPY